MNYEIKNVAAQPLAERLRSKIVAFNQAHWSVTKSPLAFAVFDDDNTLLAGISGQLFGRWLMIDWLWVEAPMRGQGLASQLLKKIEAHATAHGACIAQLDTLDFQARPFYERHGYQVKYTLEEYPVEGQRYFMEKPLR